MRTALILFTVFPFLQILPLHTYNQPYAIVTALLLLLLRPQIFFDFPKNDRLVLTWLAVLGVVLFGIALLEGVSLREIQYLVAYISPLVLTTALYYVIRRDPERFRRILIYAAVIWIGVSLIQRLISQDFMLFLIVQSEAESLAFNIQQSGRGTLGLAPEPTHHGFHMLLLAMAIHLLRGPPWVVGLALFDAILLALSSSALAALGFGTIIWALLRARRWPFLIGGVALLISIRFALLLVLDPNSRIGFLLTRLIKNNGADLLLDASVNARFYGMTEPLRVVFENVLIPFGMSHETWMDIRGEILSGNPWIMLISGSGPASGYGLILLQGGLLALPVVYYFFQRTCWNHRMAWAGILAATGFVVFLGQLYLSTPTFALLLAVSIYAHHHLRDQTESTTMPDLSPTPHR